MSDQQSLLKQQHLHGQSWATACKLWWRPVPYLHALHMHWQAGSREARQGPDLGQSMPARPCKAVRQAGPAQPRQLSLQMPGAELQAPCALEQRLETSTLRACSVTLGGYVDPA